MLEIIKINVYKNLNSIKIYAKSNFKNGNP